jgi:hypothetical protein
LIGITYLDNSLHGVLSLRHLNGALLLLKRERLIDLEAIEVEVEERFVLGAGPIEISSIFLELLKFSYLGVFNVISAVDHHLRQNLVHQALLVLSRMCHHEILYSFL